MESVIIIDLSSIRPNRQAFKSIDMLDELDEYNQMCSIHRDIYEFYYECLAGYIHNHLKENRNQLIKKRFIVYFNTRSPNSLKASEIFAINKENNDEPEFLNLIYGSQSLFLSLGFLLTCKNFIVRIFSKEKLFICKDLENTFKSYFKDDSHIFTSSHYENYCEAIECDLASLENKWRLKTSTCASSADASSIVNSQQDTGAERGQQASATLFTRTPNKFDNDFYTKCKHEIFAKCINHFKGKENQDATSFMTTFENLTIQHVNKAAKEVKLTIEQQESKLFACHMRDELIDMKFMSGGVIEMWKIYRINELDKMKESVKSFFNLTELNKYLIDIRVVEDPNAVNFMSEEDKLKRKISKYASCCFNILKILIKFRFYSIGDVTHSEYSYLNQLFGTVKAHSTSKSTNKDDIEVIKSDPYINELMLHICKQLQVICVDNEYNLEFNTTEIDNVSIGYKKEPELLLKRVTHFTEEFI